MHDVTLGLPAGPDAQRDAIHIAVVPVIAADTLEPGQHVGFVRPGDTIHVGLSDKPIGIVDPYLTKPIARGTKIWMLLYQKSITTLRHAWTHPDFPEETSVNQELADSQQRLEEIAAALGIGYSQLMDGADDWIASEDYVCQFGGESWRDIFPGLMDEFWKHYAIVTGVDIPATKRAQFFTCSC